VTWVSPDRLHITIRFIGNIDSSEAPAIQRALELPLDVAPFDLQVAGTGSFPPKGAPRAVWVGISRGVAELQQIEREISDRLEKLGIAREGRDYTPHITLARVREPAGLRAQTLLDGLADVFGTTRVDAATLFESRLSPAGPTYVALQRISLRRV
jgi:2'-5' RNA ligase